MSSSRPETDRAVAPGELTQLLHKARAGNADALNELLPLVYRELRRQAVRSLRREPTGHTLQPTALVHEVYLRLLGSPRIQWQDRVHFFAVAARLMRQVLVDYARARRAKKRSAVNTCLALGEDVVSRDPARIDILALDQVLDRLAAVDSRQGQVVEMRVFAGLTVEETAEAIGVSPRTVNEEWRMARAWLRRELKNDSSATEKGHAHARR